MLKAIGNYVVLKCIEAEKQQDKVTAEGVYIPAQFNKITSGQVINNPSKDGKIRVNSFIESIGSGVDLEKWDVHVGDEVIVNDYDVQPQGDEDGNIYALCKVESIKAVIVRD